ncbi:hypothetical protein SAMN04487846_1890 [Microbacterium sp. cf046]|uniref:dioxygenase n=1 Tax=Microbacterium sp. cf046 TaxID=1761803 RepID=UPI0008E4401C|nr:dioxygenase [Microbacterium sp. cf046]SFS04904.1 hypothetical protein SAMN04487846_1890 [Microbacterium sp. cf046]
MATGGKQRDSRDGRERARVYQARRAFHESQAKRRTRDNVIAGVGGGLLILAVIAGQVAYFVAGPGAPAPTPSATPSSTTTPGPSATPSASPAPSETPAATPTPTP